MSRTQIRNSARAWNSEFGPVCCGRVVEIDSERRPIVDFAGNPGGPVLARCVAAVTLDARVPSDETPVLLAFEQGDPARPIIVGIVQTALPTAKADRSQHAIIDGRKVILKGDEEVTLVCGKSSITLSKDGRIHLRGAEIVSRASGANKIRGASVNIN